MMKTVTIGLLTWSVGVPATLAPQVTDLTQGDTVRYVTAVRYRLERAPQVRIYPQWRIGVVNGTTPDTLLLQLLRGGTSLALPFDSLYQLNVNRGRHSRFANAPRRVAVGAGAGLIAGVVTHTLGLWVSDSGPPFRAMGISAAAGGLAGFLVSLVRPGPRRWVEIALPPVNRPGS